MNERIWDRFLTERDRKVFAASGFGAKAGFGERPALLVIDVSYDFCGDRPEPILDSIERWHLSCGEDAWEALPVIRKLIDAAHAKGLPVIYTTGHGREDGWDRGGWGWKNARTSEDIEEPERSQSNRDGNDIMDEIKPQPRDIVITKQKPSAFMDAPMLANLIHLKADSVIIAGTTTSGCVRATAVDAFSQNLRVAVVEDACFDRSQVSHAISLLDLHAKYADVLGSGEVIDFIDGLADGLFDLPEN